MAGLFVNFKIAMNHIYIQPCVKVRRIMTRNRINETYYIRKLCLTNEIARLASRWFFDLSPIAETLIFQRDRFHQICVFPLLAWSPVLILLAILSNADFYLPAHLSTRWDLCVHQFSI
jgi:hypothetical protein